MPQVEKRLKTDFDEFRLSNTNANLGRKTLIEYENQLNKMQNAQFKARSLDKSLFEKKRCLSESKKDTR